MGNWNQNPTKTKIVLGQEEIEVSVDAPKDFINKVVDKVKAFRGSVGVKVNPGLEQIAKHHKELPEAILEGDFYAINAPTC